METCQKCNSDIVTGAIYCHICGNKIVTKPKTMSISELLDAKLPQMHAYEVLILFKKGNAGKIDSVINDTASSKGFNTESENLIETVTDLAKGLEINIGSAIEWVESPNYRYLISRKTGNDFRIIDGFNNGFFTRSASALQKQEKIRIHLAKIKEPLFSNGVGEVLTWDELQSNEIFSMFNITKDDFAASKSKTSLVPVKNPNEKIKKVFEICKNPEKLFVGIGLKVKPSELLAKLFAKK